MKGPKILIVIVGWGKGTSVFVLPVVRGGHPVGGRDVLHGGGRLLWRTQVLVSFYFSSNQSQKFYIVCIYIFY